MPDARQSPSTLTICTLWEKDYHKGVGALVNSLVRVGFRGKVWAGYRGELPPWAKAGTVHGNSCVLLIANQVELVLVRLETRLHFAQYKARFMMQVLTEFDGEASGVFYFDPDVFILGCWSFFERWLTFGVAACEDQSLPLNPTHPLVRSWQAYAQSHGYTNWNGLAAYFNSGVVGVAREHLAFLQLWQDLLESLQSDYQLGEAMKTGTRALMYHIPDQDALTIATGVTTLPVSWVGQDGMAFDRGTWLTLHALSKPWRRRLLRDLIFEGKRPDAEVRSYWDLASGPIPLESPGRLRRHRWLIPFTAMLGRFYSRP